MGCKKTPLVSIGIPIYNEGKYLAKTIDSLLSQDYGNIEIIITDNNSQDNTQEICLKYVKKDCNVRYYRNRLNIGMMRNYNLAFELSQGEYFMWAGGHDLWDVSFVRRCVDVLSSNDRIALCYTLGKVIDLEDHPIRTLDGVDTRNLTIDERIKFVIEQRTNVAIFGLIRSEIIHKIMPIKCDNIPGGDIILLLEFCTYGSFAFIDEPLLYIRQIREDKSEEETVARVLKMINPFREPHNLKTYTMDTVELFLQIVEKLNLDKQQKNSLLINTVNTLKTTLGGNILKEGKALASEVIENFSNIKDIDLSGMREAYSSCKYIDLALIFYPESAILQKARYLLLKSVFIPVLQKLV